jgi:hypothetical protein
MLPSRTTHKSLLEVMDRENVFQSDWRLMEFVVPYDCFVDVTAMAMITAWGIACQSEGRKLVFSGDGMTLNYMSRMNLFRNLGIPFTEHFNRHAESGRFIPVMMINDEESVYQATNSVCDLVIHQFDNSRGFLPAMEWCVNEVIDNVRLHSESITPGAVCAQYYPQSHRLDIAIVDQGRGIKASLCERLQLASHQDAIKRALERGMTRNPNIGQGNGLAGTLDIVNCNGGYLDIWTGDAHLHVKNNKIRFKPIPTVEGTGVLIRLDTETAVNLGDIFIGDSGWSYLNVVSEQIERKGGLKVKNECLHTGGRSPATALRHKIEAVLPEMDDVLIIDFDEIESASSSFLDELLGRLAASMGSHQFQSRIQLLNMSPILENMANVVIHQRLS